MTLFRRLTRQPGILGSVLLLLVVGLLPVGSHGLRSAWAGETTDQVKAELERLAGVARDPALQGAARQALVKAALLQWFDVPEMARRSLARHWAERSPAEQQEFIVLFGDLFAGLVAEHLGEQRVRYLSEAVDGSVATVTTQFLSRREPTVVAFALRRRERGWAPYDVVIEEVSLLATYRTQFEKVIRTQSYETLVKQMRLKREAEEMMPPGPRSE